MARFKPSAEQLGQKLGPLQRKWVEALRSGKFEQGKNFLFKNGKHCCLGVACRVAGVRFYKDGVFRVFGLTETSESCVILDGGLNTLGFYSAYGRLVGKKICLEGPRGGLKFFSQLSTANDGGVPFGVIADFAEMYPWAVFREAV